VAFGEVAPVECERSQGHEGGCGHDGVAGLAGVREGLLVEVIRRAVVVKFPADDGGQVMEGGGYLREAAGVPADSQCCLEVAPVKGGCPAGTP
jgi:hypothetical protein